MKYLIINGSTRKKGNTQELLSYCGEKLNEIDDTDGEMINLTYLNINHCLGCGECKGINRCIQRDDFNDLYNKVLDSKVIVLGTPVYVGMPTSLITAFIQRLTMVAFTNQKSLRGKAGGIISVGGEAGHVATINTLSNFFLVNGMTLVGGDYWTIGFASSKGDIKQDANSNKYIDSFVANLDKVVTNI